MRKKTHTRRRQFVFFKIFSSIIIIIWIVIFCTDSRRRLSARELISLDDTGAFTGGDDERFLQTCTIDGHTELGDRCRSGGGRRFGDDAGRCRF